MSLGLMLPIGEGSHFGDTPRFENMVRMATIAREVGFEAIWLADHFLFENAETGEVRGIWEAFTMMAAVAAAVPDIQVGSLVACTGFRNPALIAKMTESIDEISGGRFILGLGAGWHKPEYDAFGLPFDYRVSRFEEAMGIIQPMLREGTATLEGEFFQARNAVNRPRGPRETGAPILVGSSGDRMLGIIAKYADAWNTVWHADTSRIPDLIAKVDAACEAEGRDPKTLIRTAGGNISMGESFGTRPNAFQGTAEEKAQHLHGFREFGFAHFVCGLDACTPDTIRSFGEVIEHFDALAG
jgi:alkanesulfonate monooxygenase SsuD/methylene tetrahydromethanopterin reductase-like flavin-dependent oxidoreductase (luciferase family)